MRTFLQIYCTSSSARSWLRKNSWKQNALTGSTLTILCYTGSLLYRGTSRVGRTTSLLHRDSTVCSAQSCSIPLKSTTLMKKLLYPNQPIHSFTEDIKRTWQIFNRPAFKHVMFLQKKYVFVNTRFLTEGVFVIQLSSDTEMSVRRLCKLRETAVSRAICTMRTSELWMGEYVALQNDT